MVAKRILTNRNGLSLVGVTVAVFFVIVTIQALFSSLIVFKSGTRHSRERSIGLSYAAELAEFFAALDSPRLAALLTAGGFPLCQQINQLDRALTTELLDRFVGDHAHPLAELSLDQQKFSDNRRVSRYYKVELVTLTTLAPDVGACGQAPAAAQPTDANKMIKGFMVTVSTSWMEGKEQAVERTVSVPVLVLRP